MAAKKNYQVGREHAASDPDRDGLVLVLALEQHAAGVTDRLQVHSFGRPWALVKLDFKISQYLRYPFHNAYGMVQRHNARMEIVSELGAGTTVSLHFQIMCAPLIGQVTAQARVSRPLRILVIDDDPTLLSSLRSILALDGHDVNQADGGKAGIDSFVAAHDSPRNFELVITDLGMPYVDGRRVAEAIKQKAPTVPVILLTGWGQRIIPETNNESVNVDQVLSKPPKLSELRTAILNWTSPER